MGGENEWRWSEQAVLTSTLTKSLVRVVATIHAHVRCKACVVWGVRLTTDQRISPNMEDGRDEHSSYRCRSDPGAG